MNVTRILVTLVALALAGCTVTNESSGPGSSTDAGGNQTIEGGGGEIGGNMVVTGNDTATENSTTQTNTS